MHTANGRGLNLIYPSPTNTIVFICTITSAEMKFRSGTGDTPFLKISPQKKSIFRNF